MPHEKSSNFNFNLFGVQTSVKQKIVFDQSLSETEFRQSLMDFLENASSMEAQLRMTSQGLLQYRDLVRQLEVISEKVPVEKADVSARLIDISKVIEGTASGLASAGLIAMIQTLLTSI